MKENECPRCGNESNLADRCYYADCAMDELYDKVVGIVTESNPFELLKENANFMINDLQGWLNKEKLDWGTEVVKGDFCQLISVLSAMVLDGKISKKEMKTILREKFDERLKNTSQIPETNV